MPATTAIVAPITATSRYASKRSGVLSSARRVRAIS